MLRVATFVCRNVGRCPTRRQEDVRACVLTTRASATRIRPDQGVARGRAPAASRPRNPMLQIPNFPDFQKRNLGNVSRVVGVDRRSSTSRSIRGSILWAAVVDAYGPCVGASLPHTVDNSRRGSTSGTVGRAFRSRSIISAVFRNQDPAAGSFPRCRSAAS